MLLFFIYQHEEGEREPIIGFTGIRDKYRVTDLSAHFNQASVASVLQGKLVRVNRSNAKQDDARLTCKRHFSECIDQCDRIQTSSRIKTLSARDTVFTNDELIVIKCFLKLPQLKFSRAINCFIWMTGYFLISCKTQNVSLFVFFLQHVWQVLSILQQGSATIIYYYDKGRGVSRCSSAGSDQGAIQHGTTGGHLFSQ